jgi:PAS domain S-box-containing protein
MASRSELGSTAAGDGLRAPDRVSPIGRRAFFALAALLLLWLSHPLTWGPDELPLWSPPAGLGLVLVAWFGFRFGASLLVACGVLLLPHCLARWLLGETVWPAWVGIEAVLGVVEPVLAWYLYHVLSRGSRRLIDPRSAMQFVLLVPIVTAVAIALVRTGLAQVVGPLHDEPSGRLFLLFWLDHALGLMVVAPPLLVIVTPLLLAHGLIPKRWAADRTGAPDHPGHYDTGRIATGAILPGGVAGGSWGEWLELIGLAFGAGVLCLLLSRLHGHELLGWQLWGVQLLFIVWASLRQGLRGGTLVAAAAAAVPLLVRQFWHPGNEDPNFQPLLQAHLLAQCGAAVLVAAAASWVRLNETGYRQVVSHIPVVIYSARLIRPRPPIHPQGPEPSPDAHSFLSPSDVEVTLVSAACSRLLGCSAEFLLGDYQRWLSCVHPEDQELLAAALEQLARQDQPVTCEYRLAGTDPGSSRRGVPAGRQGQGEGQRHVRWLRDTLAPHRDGEGRLIGWEGVVTDITEQRTLADDLRRTTSMFNALVSNLPAGVFFIQGPHGQPILLNARARQLLGQREDVSAGLEQLSQVYRLFRPDGTVYPSEELPVYLALRQGRTTMRDDIVVHRSDGRRVPLVTWAAPVQLRSRGGPDAAVWVLEDLTAMHQTRAALQDAEGHLRTIIETMAEGLLVLDARGQIVNSNPSAGSFFALAVEQLRGRSLFDLGWAFIREDGTALPAEEHPAQFALRTGRPVRHCVVGALPAASATSDRGLPTTLVVRWLLVNAMPLATVGGASRSAPGETAAGVVCTFSDISAYVHAREAIRVSEERYRALVETCPIMLMQSDRDLRITYINPATRQITGYELAELAEPALWAALIHPDDLPRCYEMVRRSLLGQPDRGELRYRAKDGSEKVAFAMSQPRYQGSVVVGTTTLLVDITRERQLEHELQRSQRLEMIGRLSSGVAHDFNNLLGVVLNLTDLARGHLPPDHPVHSDLKRISEASEQAASLAAQLLALGKRGRSGTRRIEINTVVRRTLELLRATLPSSIRLETNLAEGELYIQADETQVQQVLMNLCLNSRDAMPRGGLLRVSTALASASESEEWREKTEDTTSSLSTPRSRSHSFVRLLVEDSGQGMSEEVRSHIFEPFFSTKEGGTGLGLAVVQQIVESYGGRIDVRSQLGQGTRFDVSWPASAPALAGVADRTTR